MHQRMASTMFDLPHPLGPTTAVTGSSIWSTVLSQKDLKPMISIFLIRMVPRVTIHVGQPIVALPIPLVACVRSPSQPEKHYR